MATRPPTTSDRIARLARLAWGGAEVADDESDAASAALDHLRIEHADWARVDFGSLHPSWAVRALKAESPAVRRAVAARAPAEVAGAIREGLGLAEVDLETDHPAHPIAVATALSLWSERLVGGPPARPDEHPMVAAVAGSGREERRRVFHLIGLAKWSFASDRPAEGARDDDRARFEHFREFWGDVDPRLAHIARLDLRSAGDPDPIPARLALITVGRLLGEVEPARARWLLQHLPYDAARWTRLHANLENPLVSRRSLLAWERQILSVATDRLLAESEPEPEIRPEPGAAP